MGQQVRIRLLLVISVKKQKQDVNLLMNLLWFLCWFRFKAGFYFCWDSLFLSAANKLPLVSGFGFSGKIIF